MTDDLNQRVQARLAQLEQESHHPYGDGDFYVAYADLGGLDTFQIDPSLLLKFVSSWRERWERHQPHVGLPGDQAPSGCWDCRDMVGDRIYILPSLCPDALAVLRELGMEP